jgi:hypothetical protein
LLSIQFTPFSSYLNITSPVPLILSALKYTTHIVSQAGRVISFTEFTLVLLRLTIHHVDMISIVVAVFVYTNSQLQLLLHQSVLPSTEILLHSFSNFIVFPAYHDSLASIYTVFVSVNIVA